MRQSADNDPLRLRDPKNVQNWILSCKWCGMTWPSRTTMGEVYEHFAAHEGRRVDLKIEWLGIGRVNRRFSETWTNADSAAGPEERAVPIREVLKRLVILEVSEAPSKYRIELDRPLSMQPRR